MPSISKTILDSILFPKRFLFYGNNRRAGVVWMFVT
jgi:hypothetical protein